MTNDSILRYVFDLTGDNDPIKGIVLPPLTRLFVVKVEVDPAVDWDILLQQASPNSNHIKKMSQHARRHFPPVQEDPYVRYVYGLNISLQVASFHAACNWATSNGLFMATPREVYSIGPQVPDLPGRCHTPTISLLSSCPAAVYGKTRVCELWYDLDSREVDMWPLSKRVGGFHWVCFARPAGTT